MSAARGAVRRGSEDPGASSAKPVPSDRVTRPSNGAEEELLAALGTRDAGRFRQTMADAERAFTRERYLEVRKVLAPAAVELADVPTAREMLGLSLYRLGRWKAATVELEAHRTLTHSAEHLAVLADCYRALRRHAKVVELWEEIRAASPSAALVAEGRIVMAGSLADRGDVRGALTVMQPALAVPRRIRAHHLSMWYVLGDLMDRSGDTTGARKMFQRIRDVEPGFADVDARLSSLGR